MDVSGLFSVRVKVYVQQCNFFGMMMTNFEDNPEPPEKQGRGCLRVGLLLAEMLPKAVFVKNTKLCLTTAYCNSELDVASR